MVSMPISPSGSPNSFSKDASACRAIAISFSTAPLSSRSGAISYQRNGARVILPHFSRTTASRRSRTSSAPSAAISSTPHCRFARAYPDNQSVLDLVQDLLDHWERRADVRALGEALQGLGMAGVANAYPFFWPTARWLAERWPGALHVDWDNLEDADGVASLLKLLVPRAESPALEELPLTARQRVRHLKRDD